MELQKNPLQLAAGDEFAKAGEHLRSKYFSNKTSPVISRQYLVSSAENWMRNLVLLGEYARVRKNPKQMKKQNTLKEVATYYLYLRLAQWYMKEHKGDREKTIETFNLVNNFNRTKSQCILFLMCTASTNRKRLFELYNWKTSHEEPWMIETAFDMQWNTPLILSDQHSIEWGLFGIKINDSHLFSEPPSVVVMILSSYLFEKEVKEFSNFTIEVERTIEKLCETRRCSDFALWSHEVYAHKVKSQTSWYVYSQLPNESGKIIPHHTLIHEKSVYGEGKCFSFM